jgi:hypothetical protein
MSQTENPCRRSWKSITATMGNGDVQAGLWPLHVLRERATAPNEKGAGLREGLVQVLDSLGVPRDARGIVLLCGYVASAAFGLIVLLSPPGDPIGWAYVGLAAMGYFFIQTRGLTTFLWLLFAGGGAAVVFAGEPSGWVECVLGLALAAVAITPLPADYRQPTAPAIEAMGPGRVVLASIGGVSTSGKVEDSRAGTSANAEVSNGASPNGATDASVRLVTTTSNAGDVRIAALGSFLVEADGADVSQGLEPRLEFLFGYLLARTVGGRDGAADRTALAEEVAPGIGPPSQRDRLRKQLYDLQSLHPVLARLVRVSRSRVSLDLQGVDFDVTRLLEISHIVAGPDSLIDTSLANRVRGVLAKTDGEFLAGFSELEHQVTGGRGSAAEVVEQARVLIAGARADLALAIARYDTAAGHAQRAIVYMTQALKQAPHRQDLARALVAAYLQTGQVKLARDARREFDLIE